MRLSEDTVSRAVPAVPHESISSDPYFEEDGNEVCDCLDLAARRLGERK